MGRQGIEVGGRDGGRWGLRGEVGYHVGVSAILRSLGFFDRTAAFAGASGGAIAAAYSCSKDRAAQLTFRTGVGALVSCRMQLSFGKQLQRNP
jgi:hypothetical protein